MIFIYTYSLLKSGRVSQQFAFGRKKDSDSLTAVIRIILVLTSHTSLNHTLCLRSFQLSFSSFFLKK